MKRFRNWSGSVAFRPREIQYPESEIEIQELVKQCIENGRRIRVVGSAHSFSPLIETDSVLICLDRLSGIIQWDETTGIAEVWAGTKLHVLNELLFEKGRALENMGDIDRQAIGGIVSTGTHGTGVLFGTLSTLVTGITMVDGTGGMKAFESHNPLLKAAQVSVGALGVITRLKIRTVPAFRLKMEQRSMKLSEIWKNMEAFKNRYRHFEFFLFPYSDSAQVKLTNTTDESARGKTIGQRFNDVVMENLVFKILSEISRWIPGAAAWISRLCASGISSVEKVDWSHRVFPVPRWVKFQEMEYSVPAEKMQLVVTELMNMIRNHKIAVHFPLECRFVKGDDLWLSHAYGRDSAFISIHMYRGMKYREYFDRAQSIFLSHGGRPHWGKMHFLKASQFQNMYPRWAEFQAFRAQMDPHGIFLNTFLKSSWELK